MKNRWHVMAWCVALATLATLAGCQQSNSKPVVVGQEDGTAYVQLGELKYRLSGPYAHENLAVFLLHGDKQDDADYLTLDQGLKDGVVQVSEKEEGQVHALLIDNRSERPLFLQEGDRVQGGKQDRTLYSSLVIPANSGPMPIPTFCIEHGRWTAGARGAQFSYTANAALAPKEVRQAAKVDKNQGEVWDAVADQKKQATDKLAAPNTNSSLNESLDAPAVKKLSEDCSQALGDALKNHSDAIGVAIVVNGKVEEVNLYPNHSLLEKLYPRLLQSYAVQAALHKDEAKDAAPACAKDVAQFMTEGRDRKAQPAEQVNNDNRLCVESIDENKYKCSTEFQGKPVHQQFFSRAPSASPARGTPGAPNAANDNRQQAQPSNPPPSLPPSQSPRPQR